MRDGWRKMAACRNLPPALFYSDGGNPEDSACARSVCMRCPVCSDCLEWAVLHEEFGLWAGTSNNERQQIRKERGIRMSAPEGPLNYLIGQELHNDPLRRSGAA